MTGHERIVSLRRQRLRPDAVFVTDVPPCNTGSVHVMPDDIPEMLDLRFLAGLLVHVSVEDTPHGRRIAAACASASARCIAAYHSPHKRGAIEITDTEHGQWKF